MSLMKRWGLGVDLDFDGGSATVKMSRTRAAVVQLRESFDRVGNAAQNFAGKVGQLGMVLAPIAAGMGLVLGQGSRLASDLEAQTLTMRVLLGDAAKAEQLIGMIRENAAATPFEEGDLIEGSKRLLRLSGDNLDKNMEMLKVMETMSALNPGKSVTDSVEALLDGASGGGFERMKEFGIALRAEDFAHAGKPGGEAWGQAVFEALQAEMDRLTKGEDLVGALSRTFTGRMSTLKDSVSNVFREIGIVVNEEVGPMLEPLTAGILAQVPAIRAAALQIVEVIRGIARSASPYVETVRGWWVSLGTEGQSQIWLAVGAILTLISVLVPVGGVLGAVGFAVVSLLGALGALWGMVTATGSAIAAAMAPSILLPVAAALGAVTIGAVALFAALQAEGEGPIDTLARLGGAIWDNLVAIWEYAGPAFDSALSGFESRALGLLPIVETLGDSVRPLLELVDQLMMALGGDGPTLQFWKALGGFIGALATFFAVKLVRSFELVTHVLGMVILAIRPMILAISEFGSGLFGLVDGTMTFREAFEHMIRGVSGAIVAMLGAMGQFLLGGLEFILRAIVLALDGIPGVGPLLERTGDLGADKIGRIRAGLESEISNAIAGVDLASQTRAGAKAEASAPTVTVDAPTFDAPVRVETTVILNERDIAKGLGEGAIRSGQRQGDTIPAAGRGKIVRGGVVQTLQPSEVL